MGSLKNSNIFPYLWSSNKLDFTKNYITVTVARFSHSSIQTLWFLTSDNEIKVQVFFFFFFLSGYAEQCVCLCVCPCACACVCVCVCVTIVRDDAPGGEGSVQASQHPKHAEPTEMFSSFIHLQELGEVGVDDGDGPTNTGQTKKAINKKVLSNILHLHTYR